MSPRHKFTSVDEFIDSFSGITHERLQAMREAIHEAVPGATEVISYNIAAFKLTKPFVYIAGYTHHVSVYPIPQMDKTLEMQVKKYIHGKGTLRYPHTSPLPVDLIKQVARIAAK